MASIPRYGGYNGVEELDLGQSGSTRLASGDALYTCTTRMERQDTRIVRNELCEQGVTFENVLGPGGERHTWTGLLEVKDATVLQEITNELMAAKDGFTRAGGVRTAFDSAQIRPTTLVDGRGKTVSKRARIDEWRFADRIMRLPVDPGFEYAVRLTISFVTLA